MTQNVLRMPRLSDSMSEATIVAWLKQPGEASGGVIFRELASLTVTSDHRAVYGADAARFLGRIEQLLENPLALVL